MNYKKGHTKLVQEGNYVAEVAVELIYTDEVWSPYLSLDDAHTDWMRFVRRCDARRSKGSDSVGESIHFDSGSDIANGRRKRKELLTPSALIIVTATSAPFRAVELVGRGFIPGRRRRGMNPPATNKTRLKPATAVLLCELAETMIVATPHPDSPGQGVGGHLIEEGLRRLSASGVDLVFVLGHPDYYPRHGFRPAGALGFKAPYPIPDKNADAWMVQELRPGLIGTVRGTVVCADALDKPEYWRE